MRNPNRRCGSDSSTCHVWDAFQLAHASFRLYCVRNNLVVPEMSQMASGNLGPHLLGDPPKINVPPPEAGPEDDEESNSDSLPAIKIYDDDVCLVHMTNTSFLLQWADRELRPWIAKDDDLGQQMWRINQRIVKLIAELIRNHDTAESLVIVASAPDLLLRVTDGMLVDGEACTLPQLELLEVTARAIQPVLDWGESGQAVAEGLTNLLKGILFARIGEQ